MAKQTPEQIANGLDLVFHDYHKYIRRESFKHEEWIWWLKHGAECREMAGVNVIISADGIKLNQFNRAGDCKSGWISLMKGTEQFHIRKALEGIFGR